MNKSGALEVCMPMMIPEEIYVNSGRQSVFGDNIEIDNNEKIKYESLCGNCYIKKLVEGVNEDVI